MKWCLKHIGVKKVIFGRIDITSHTVADGLGFKIQKYQSLKKCIHKKYNYSINVCIVDSSCCMYILCTTISVSFLQTVSPILKLATTEVF